MSEGGGLAVDLSWLVAAGIVTILAADFARWACRARRWPRQDTIADDAFRRELRAWRGQ